MPSSSTNTLQRWDDHVMRFADITIAFAMLLVTAIPMLAISLAIKLDDKGPILFLQPRVGKDRVVFKIAKFRTMTHDPARAIGAVQGKVTQAERQAFQTTSANDSRITRVGRVLRPLHLDELPQILNVLFGQMSLVGVRPDVPVQEIEYTPQEWHDRHVLRPGITGWAQISPKVASMADRTAHDLYWTRHRSIGLYFRILLSTIRKVLKRNSL